MAYVYWFTGLSGAGKSTIAERVKDKLEGDNYKVAIIDGDQVREKLHRHLGFSKEDILENNRLIAELCNNESPNFDIILVPIISPFEEGRNFARNCISSPFLLVFFSTPLAVVEERDVKKLYQKARSGIIKDMIGVANDRPYEIPKIFDLEINSTPGIESIEESACKLYNFIITNKRAT